MLLKFVTNGMTTVGADIITLRVMKSWGLECCCFSKPLGCLGVMLKMFGHQRSRLAESWLPFSGGRDGQLVSFTSEEWGSISPSKTSFFLSSCYYLPSSRRSMGVWKKSPLRDSDLITLCDTSSMLPMHRQAKHHPPDKEDFSPV